MQLAVRTATNQGLERMSGNTNLQDSSNGLLEGTEIKEGIKRKCNL
jgi:hypothetical protein